MTRRAISTYATAVLVALAMLTCLPNVSLGQDNQAVPQAPQPVGGTATVVGVDQPENCLRIRSGPGNAYEIIGCANLGDKLNITGVWTSNDWAQLADNGWVYGPQIETDLRPPQAAFSQSYPEVEYPAYATEYYVDDYYLPTYGYTPYWYSGIPLYLYNINEWRRHHPWWKTHKAYRGWGHKGDWARHQKGDAWRQGRNQPNAAANLRPRTQQGSVVNRPVRSPSNVTRSNTGSFRSGTANRFTPGRTFSAPTNVRSFSSPNRARTNVGAGTRSFSSSPRTISPRVNTGAARSFSNVGRSFNAGSVRAARSFAGSARMGSGGVRIGGGGARIGGGGMRMGGGGGGRRR